MHAMPAQVASPCRYLIPLDVLPDPFWRYPMHFLGFHTYAINAAVLNEFEGTRGWACPCTLQDGGCGAGKENCELTGEEVRAHRCSATNFAITGCMPSPLTPPRASVLPCAVDAQLQRCQWKLATRMPLAALSGP